MLDLDRIDLRSLADALEDHSGKTVWGLDPRTGAVEPFPDGGPPDGWVLIEPLPSRASYEDMEDFIARVREARAREALQRAIAGRGAFRRFKDTLFEFLELREAWFSFHDTRMRRHAIRWLRDEGLIEDGAGELALARTRDPDLPQLGKPFDSEAISRAVASDLRALYGARLREVLLYGSWARGDAREDSDIDLLVVLDRVDSAYAEIERMSEIGWRHSFENDTVVSLQPISEEEARARNSAFVRNVLREGRRVA